MSGGGVRDTARAWVNRFAGCLGVRIVSSSWGPAGFGPALRRILATGWHVYEVIDVGAARGEWTTECRRLLPEARYLLIDPLPENAPLLEQMVAGDGKLAYWQGAVGSVDGHLAIRSHGDQSSVLMAADEEFRGAELLVELRTLDSFLDSGHVRRPNLVKLDVQGYELEVLRGATRVLQAAGAVLVELSFRRLYVDQPLAHEVIGLLADHGFRIADICTYSQRARDGALLQADVLFVGEGVLRDSDERFF